MVNRLNFQSDNDLIIADQHGGGYFLPKLPDDEEYCRAYINQTFSRAKKEKRKGSSNGSQAEKADGAIQ